jgi:hypothetical protein
MADGSSPKRSKNETGSYIRYWNLSVLQDKYQGKMKVFCSDFLIDCSFVVNVLNNILEYNEKYKGFLKTQKRIRLRDNWIRPKSLFQKFPRLINPFMNEISMRIM